MFFNDFPYSDYRGINMDWFLKTFRKLIKDWDSYKMQMNLKFNNLSEEFRALHDYVMDYFRNLDVQEEISQKLNEMDEDGSLDAIVSPFVSQWLASHITPTTPAVDRTLNISGAASDSYVVGRQTIYPTAYNFNTTNRATIDTDSKTISFPSNMLIGTSMKYSSTNSPQVLDYSEMPSNIYAIVFNFNDKTFSMVSLNNKPSIIENYGLIGVIRSSNSALYDSNNFFEGYFLDNAGINALFNNLFQRISKWKIYYGSLFLSICGNKLFADLCSLRLYDATKQTYTTQTDLHVIISKNFTYTAVKYINLIYDETSQSFDITWTNNPNENTIAVYSPKQTNNYTILKPYINDEALRVNCRPLSACDHYIRPSTNSYINFERLPKLVDKDSAFSLTDEDIRYDKLLYKFKGAGTRIYNQDKIFYLLNILNNDTDISSKKILMIGDSFIARGWIQNYLNQYEPTLEFIGTRRTQNYNFLSEGISGSNIIAFTGESSPFYFNGQLDFAQYLITNRLEAPDYVVINTCINGSQTGIVYQEEMQKLINMVKSYNNNIKIYVTIGANYENNYGIKASDPNRRKQLVEERQLSVFSLNDCVLIPINEILHHLDYPAVSINYNDDVNIPISVVTDPVHPSESVGFKKIAEQIFNYLGV